MSEVKMTKAIEVLPELRWWTDAAARPPILQQAYRKPGDDRIYWRDVPFFYEPAKDRSNAEGIGHG